MSRHPFLRLEASLVAPLSVHAIEQKLLLRHSLEAD
jgi:hypothetical protein